MSGPGSRAALQSPWAGLEGVARGGREGSVTRGCEDVYTRRKPRATHATTAPAPSTNNGGMIKRSYGKGQTFAGEYVDIRVASAGVTRQKWLSLPRFRFNSCPWAFAGGDAPLLHEIGARDRLYLRLDDGGAGHDGGRI